MKQKFFSKKIVLPDGTIFDSKLEYKRWLFLLDQQKQGNITDLSRQTSYELIPKQYKYEYKQMKTKTKVVKVLAERPCSYKADFTYKVNVGILGFTVVEDTKSIATRTPEYRIKRKLMLRVHGISIQEISKPTQPIFTPPNILLYEKETSSSPAEHTPVQD